VDTAPVWLARGSGSNGRIITIELNPKHADVAEENFRTAGLEKTVTVRRGPAHDILQELISLGAGPFDFIFIDAEKANSVEYFKFALQLSRPGTMIVADNTVRGGDLADINSCDLSVIGVRQLHEVLAKTTRVLATTLQTVGCKGYDGFTLAVVADGEVLGMP
jgi:predicted O-methyltransferase YrrM